MASDHFRWRIYYGNGDTYSDRDGSPFYAPSTNVQVLAREMADGAIGLSHGRDAYYWRDDFGWNGCDAPGLWDYMLNHVGPKQVIFGRTIRDDAFWATVDRARLEGVGDA